MTINEIVTVIALVTGPVAAIGVSILWDEKKAKRDRRMSIFRELMKTRGLPLSPDLVTALNLVAIEFHKDKAVIEAWKNYIRLLNQDLKSRNAEQLERFRKDEVSSFTRLLGTIAKSLKFEMDSLDILETGYTPVGWATIEAQQQAIRSLLIEVLNGSRPLTITAATLPTPSYPYPSAPNVLPKSETGLPIIVETAEKQSAQTSQLT